MTSMNASIFDSRDLFDPTPDIHALFVHYQSLYFHDALGGVSIEWSSSRMTLCGGNCQKIPGGAIIKLSKPLLSLRPTADLKNVILHEMIHAYIMVNNIRDDDPSGHGFQFQSLAHEINSSTLEDHQRPSEGYAISIYHTMFQEVDHYRKHHWQCTKCHEIIKRAMNRPPQAADCRNKAGTAGCRDPLCTYHVHERQCGKGTYIKIKEPEDYIDRKKRKRNASNQNLKDTGQNTGKKRSTEISTLGNRNLKEFFAPFQGIGNVLGQHTPHFDAPITLPSLAAVLNTQSEISKVSVLKNTLKSEKTKEDIREVVGNAALKRFDDDTLQIKNTALKRFEDDTLQIKNTVAADDSIVVDSGNTVTIESLHEEETVIVDLVGMMIKSGVFMGRSFQW